MTPAEQKEKLYNECCKLANERFGLSMALKKAMIKIGCTHDEAVEAVEHAKNRDHLKFNAIMDGVNYCDSKQTS